MNTVHKNKIASFSLHGNEIEFSDPINQKDWNERLLNSTGYSIFHTSNWARVLFESNQCRPVYLSVQENKKFKFLLPLMSVNSWITGNRGVSLPFTDYCFPIHDGSLNSNQIYEKIASIAMMNGWKTVELRGGINNTAYSSITSKYHRHVLSIEGTEKEIFSKFRSNYRRKIKKGLKTKHKIIISQSSEDVINYYKLHCLTRKRHGLPYQPKSFFKKIDEHIISKRLGVIVLLSHEGRFVAGDVIFLFGDKAIYKFGGLDIRYQHLNASYIVMWEAIRWLSQNGYNQLCFGRTDIDDVGLNQFKKGWGTKTQELNYYTVGEGTASLITNRNKLKNIGQMLFSRMPDPVLKISGSLLYRHFG